MTKYFSRYDWYKPVYTELEVDNLFNDFERHNVDLIKGLELNLRVKQKLDQINSYEEISFIDYISIVPKIKLPIKFKCEKGFKRLRVNNKNDTIRKFKPEGATIIGKLCSNESEPAFIYSYPADTVYPMIKKYDLLGNEINELRIFALRDCVTDEEYSATTFGIIDTDFKVKAETQIINCTFEIGINKCGTTYNSFSFMIN